MKLKYPNQIVCVLMILLSLASSLEMFGQDKPFSKNATIYLVRHAEKDTGFNPALSASGRSRAAHLVSALEGNAIHKIFVSQFRRTQETADPFRVQMKVDTVHYVADASGEALIKTLEKHEIKNEKIMIIGHSNTIPIIIGRLGISKPVSMSDMEYNTIYLIKYVKGEPMLFRKKFGDPMVQSENTSWEEVL